MKEDGNKILKKMDQSDVERLLSKANDLLEKYHDDYSCEGVKDLFWKLERCSGLITHNKDLTDAKFKVLSGMVLLKAKESVPHGEWAQFAVANYDISEYKDESGEHCRY